MTTERLVLPPSRVSASAQPKVGGFHREVLEEVQAALTSDRVVVVGMAQNPHVRRARKALEGAGIAFRYLEYGSYLSEWKKRLAIKMWSGWPTFPQVFVDGALIGGANETEAAIAAKTLV